MGKSVETESRLVSGYQDGGMVRMRGMRNDYLIVMGYFSS